MRHIQRSFAGGEIAPALHARSDTAKYRAGLKLAKNFLPTRTGELRVREGSVYSPLNAAIAARVGSSDFKIFPWIIEGVNYVVVVYEFSSTVCEFALFTEDGTLIDGWKYIIASFDGLRFVTQGRLGVWTSGISGVSGVRGNHPTLVTFNDADANGIVVKELTDDYVSTTRVPAPSAGLLVNASAGTVTLYYAVTSVDAEGVESLPSALVSRVNSLEPTAANAATVSWTLITHAATYRVYRYIAGVPGFVGSSAQGNWVDFGAVPDFAAAPPEALLTVPNQVSSASITLGTVGVSTRAYGVQTVRRDGARSQMVVLDAAGYVNADGGNPVELTFTVPTDASSVEVYRSNTGTAGQMFLVGQVDGSGVRGVVEIFTDNGLALGANGGFFDTDTAHFFPDVAAFVQQRLAFAFSNRPGVVMMSNIGTYDRFMKHPTPVDDDAVEFTISGCGRITALSSLQGTLLFSEEGEWALNADGSSITPNNIVITRQGFGGSVGIDPPHAAQTVLAFEARGGTLRGVTFDQRGDSYRSTDLSTYAAHLSGYTVTSAAYSRTPNSVLYAVTDLSTVRCMTFVPEHEIVAWSRMQFKARDIGDQDTYTDVKQVMVLPDGNGDRVYFRMRGPSSSTAKDIIVYHRSDAAANVGRLDYLVSTPYSGGVPNNVITGLDHMEGCPVWVYDLLGGHVLGEFEVTGGQIVIDPSMRHGSVAHTDFLQVGMKIDAEIQTLDIDLQDAETISSLKKRLAEVTVQCRDTQGLSIDGVEVPLRTTEGWNEGQDQFTGRIRQSVSSTWDDGATVSISNSPGLQLIIQSITSDFEVGT